MKYIIYVKNKKNELVGIYTLKKITKVASLVDIKKTKKDIYYNGKMNNNNWLCHNKWLIFDEK